MALWKSKPIDWDTINVGLWGDILRDIRKCKNAVEAHEHQNLPQHRNDMLVRGNHQATNWVVWVHPTVWYLLPQGEEYLRRARNGGYG